MLVSLEPLPKNLAEAQSHPLASLDKPEYPAALFIAACIRYPESKGDALDIINWLKGPSPLSEYERQFLTDRMDGKASYIGKSFLIGAAPENDYSPSEMTVEITENPYSYQDDGYAKLYLKSGGADSPRPISLRLKPSAGKWYLNEQMLLSDIRIPQSADSWA